MTPKMNSSQSQPEAAASENSTTPTTVSTVPASNNQFMHTPEFHRHFVEYVPDDTLMALRLATKRWMREVESLLTRIVKNGGQRGEMIVCGSINAKWSRNQGERAPLHEKFSLVTRVIFLLNVTKVGNYVCAFAANLVEVEIPEGITSIGVRAFYGCRILTTVSFPTTLISISSIAFLHCSSLENVDLLHTNVQELGNAAFDECSELKSMTIPDSLQTLGHGVFNNCSKLVPRRVNDCDSNEVVAFLRSKQN